MFRLEKSLEIHVHCTCGWSFMLSLFVHELSLFVHVEMGFLSVRFVCGVLVLGFLPFFSLSTTTSYV